VLALDIRGHGGSSPGRDGYDMARLAEDVRTVLTTLDVRDAVVVGHSLGGMTALQLLVDHPELARDATVSAIALISTSASMVIGNGVPAMLARLGNAITPTAGRSHAYATAGNASHRIRTNLASLYCRLAFGAAPSPTHVEVVRAMTAAVPPAVLSPLIVTLINLDIRTLLAAITVPTLIVVGQRDLVTPFWHSRYLASHIPGSELVVLPGCGHMVPFERHAELSKLLVGWGEAIR
jgi:pimeloyl-ACP methyl ester carboxylesterase